MPSSALRVTQGALWQQGIRERDKGQGKVNSGGSSVDPIRIIGVRAASAMTGVLSTGVSRIPEDTLLFCGQGRIN